MSIDASTACWSTFDAGVVPKGLESFTLKCVFDAPTQQSSHERRGGQSMKSPVSLLHEELQRLSKGRRGKPLIEWDFEKNLEGEFIATASFDIPRVSPRKIRVNSPHSAMSKREAKRLAAQRVLPWLQSFQKLLDHAELPTNSLHLSAASSRAHEGAS
jgi:hypothetical protein